MNNIYIVIQPDDTVSIAANESTLLLPSSPSSSQLSQPSSFPFVPSIISNQENSSSNLSPPKSIMIFIVWFFVFFIIAFKS
jgi:hypothetical protein